MDSLIVEALLNFPTLTNHTDLRAFIGLVNQLSSSTPYVASHLEPLRPLLSMKNNFVWSSDLQEKFDLAKGSLAEVPVLSYFEPKKPTRLCTDASHACLPSHPQEPIVLKLVSERPFQELAVDFCSYAGNEFLIMVDCSTDWPDIIHMGRNTTTPRLIAALKQAFCRSGVPDVV